MFARGVAGVLTDGARVAQEIPAQTRQEVLQSGDFNYQRTSSARTEEYLSAITSAVEQALTAIESGVSIQNPKFLEAAGLPGTTKIRENLGVASLSIPVVGGSIELSIPPKPDLVSRALDFIGMPDAKDPIKCTLKDSCSNILFELTLDHKNLAENKPAEITSFGQYSSVRRDGELGAWVGQTQGTTDWMLECLKTFPALVTSGSLLPSEMLPKQEAARLEATTRFMLQSLQNPTLSSMSVDTLKEISDPSKLAADVQNQINTLGNLTKRVSKLLGKPNGMSHLALRYPRAHIDSNANSMTLPTLSDGSTITISAPAPLSVVRRCVHFLLGIEPGEAKCVVKRAGKEILALTLSEHDSPKLVRCAGFSNLSPGGHGVRGVDAAQRKSNAEILKFVMDNTNVHNPFDLVRGTGFIAKSIQPPSRALASDEVTEISEIVAGVIAGFSQARP
jgi:hypothetical protein